MQSIRAAALPLLLLAAACGRGPSRAELQDRVAKLEDENDTLKQQLGEARDALAERRPEPDHASRRTRRMPATAAVPEFKRPAHAARLEREIQGTAYPRAPRPPRPAREAENAAVPEFKRPAHAARLAREIQGTAYPRAPRPPRPAREAENAAAQALVAAADARQAMAQR